MGVPFDITVDDVVIPTHCPILGIKLCSSRGQGGNFSLHRRSTGSSPDWATCAATSLIPARANGIKNNNASSELLRMVVDWIDANAPTEVSNGTLSHQARGLSTAEKLDFSPTKPTRHQHQRKVSR